MPPAAPAKEWITESPGIVESRDVDGECGFKGSSHLIRKVLKVGLMTRDIGLHERQTLDREVLGIGWREGGTVLQCYCVQWLMQSSSRRHNAEYYGDVYLGEPAESYQYLRRYLQKPQSVNK
jgi:hypothetical protein